MQLEQNIIVTSLEELKDIVRHCSLDNMEGQINLTIKGNDIEVWQPSKEAGNDGVVKPKIILMPAIKVKHEIGFMCDEINIDAMGYVEPQPSDNIQH